MANTGWLLWMGDPYQWENDWIVAPDDGLWHMGLTRLYEALTTGDYAGSTNITVNSKTDAHSNACVLDKRTGLIWSKNPSGSVGPSSDGLLYWDDHLVVITFQNQTGDFNQGALLTDQVSGATAYLRYVDNTNEKLGIANVTGTFGAGNEIRDDHTDASKFGDNSGQTIEFPGTQDTFLGSKNSGYNYGASILMYAGTFIDGSDYKLRALIAFDFKSFDTDHPTATITAARFKFTVGTFFSSPGDLNIYPVLRTWGSGSGDWDVDEGTKDGASADVDEPTWDDAQDTNAAWATAGAKQAGGDGTSASHYDAGNDVGSTSLGSVTIAANGPYTITLNATGRSVIETQAKNANCRLGFLLEWSHEGDAGVNRYITIESSESATGTKKPYLELDYDDPGIADIATGGIRTGAKEDIFEYCRQANLQELAGFTDWRVPNIAELASIMLYNTANGNAEPDSNYFTFPGTTENVWSGTHYDSAQIKAVVATFDDGLIARANKAWDKGYAYLVRGPDLTASRKCLPIETSQYLIQDSQFKCDGFMRKGLSKSWTYTALLIIDTYVTAGYINGDTEAMTLQSSVLDNNTGLIWMMDTNDAAVPYYDDTDDRKDALGYMHYANEHSFGGARDWRIPTVFEYLSVLLGTNGKLWSTFWKYNTRDLWTSTNVPDDSDKCFVHSPGEYFAKKDKSSDTAYVRLVRGGYTDDDL